MRFGGRTGGPEMIRDTTAASFIAIAIDTATSFAIASRCSTSAASFATIARFLTATARAEI